MKFWHRKTIYDFNIAAMLSMTLTIVFLFVLLAIRKDVELFKTKEAMRQNYVLTLAMGFALAVVLPIDIACFCFNIIGIIGAKKEKNKTAEILFIMSLILFMIIGFIGSAAAKILRNSKNYSQKFDQYHKFEGNDFGAI
ncbi:hypothetical protein [Mycoplasma phocoeninasale]|uniref:hypothetical protein n=1 Tax=Mycoplasma phocoeninasale TaxID=2726117 RepID=UPI00196709F9|nr:hypothetical protein [Mycoplasma phocoeninasale]MBN0970531.1 hypothetical protein [Mycoplasma phocoeninasale]